MEMLGLRQSKIVLATKRRLRYLFGRFVLRQRFDLGHGKERQVSPWLIGIRSDHKERYYFASQQIDRGNILDLACGVGYGSYILSKGGEERSVSGVDLSSFAIKYATENYNNRNIEYINKDAGNFVGKKLYDNIVSFETLEHIEDEVSFIRLLHSLGSPGCKLFISTPNELSYKFYKEKNPFHVRHHTPDQLDTLLTENGWKIIDRFSQKDGKQGSVINDVTGRFLLYKCKKV